MHLYSLILYITEIYYSYKSHNNDMANLNKSSLLVYGYGVNILNNIGESVYNFKYAAVSFVSFSDYCGIGPIVPNSNYIRIIQATDQSNICYFGGALLSIGNNGTKLAISAHLRFHGSNDTSTGTGTNNIGQIYLIR